MTKRLIPHAEIVTHAREYQASAGLTEDEFQRDLAFRIDGVQRLGFLAEEKEMTMSEQVESKSGKTKAKKDLTPKPRRFTQRLEVDLTEKERLALTQTLVGAMQAVNEMIDEKRELVSLKNANIKVAQDEVKKLAASCRSCKEERDVECYEEWSFATNTATVFRADTKARVSERALLIEERQATLPGVDAPKPGEPLTATVGEIAGGKKAKKGGVAALLDDVAAFAVAPESTFNRCEKTSAAGEQCTRPAAHRGAHGYRDPSPKA